MEFGKSEMKAKKGEVEGEKPAEEKEEKIILSREEYEKLLAQASELEATRDKLLRTAADYDNARKRLAREREEFVKFGQERLIRELLPVLDNFDRALAHAGESEPAAAESASALMTGLQMILKQFHAVLTAQGLEKFSSEGQAFDPHLHEAVGQVEEEGQEGIVVHELEAGYKLYDRVVRPAKVRIRVNPRKSGDRSWSKETKDLSPDFPSKDKEEEIT